MDNEQENKKLIIVGLGIALGVAGIITAIAMKKGFWVGVGFYFLGSALGSGIGYVAAGSMKSTEN